MNQLLENTVQINGTSITSYNNINLDLSLSFNNLTYTLSYENSKQYLTTNSLLLNIEDIDSIYNVFKHNNVQFSYQLNNILFIDNNQNMHILSYNLRNKRNFTIDNNSISFNVLEKLDNKLNNINWQTVFAYNSNHLSYIYSDENKLTFMTNTQPGLYYIDNDDIILNNDRLSINVNKFNYNYLHINNMVNKINNIISNYSYNINLFGQTKKYKNSTFTNNLQLINDYNNYEINITTATKNYKLNYKNEIINNTIISPQTDIFIKDTDYIIIDLPIEYEYETVINTDFQYNRNICPININQFNFKIFDTNITSKIAFNQFKSFIYNNQPISITYNDQNEDNIEHVSILKESCRVSLYFNIDKNIYEETYNSSKDINDEKNKNNYTFKLKIQYKTISYYINCYIDIMNNQFKKLYHNYNYGFNYDNHGEAIGIMFLPKNTNKSITNYHNYIKLENNPVLKEIDNNNKELYPINKDIFINYNSNSIDDILLKFNHIDYNQLYNKWGSYINFSKIYYRTINSNNGNVVLSNQLINTPNQIILSLLYPQRLKNKNWTLLYKNNQPTIYNYPEFNGEKNILVDHVNLGNRGTINIFKNDNDVINVNDLYIMDKEQHKSTFNMIYNYRKSGLLCGDYYTPCLLDYMLIYLFGIENYFDIDPYNEYKNKFCKPDVSRGDNEEYQYRLLTNQFYKSGSNILQYSVNLTKNNFQTPYNNYIINLYNLATSNKQQEINYIWPLFRIPDYSIINSNDYIIMYSNKENCEYVDYYFKPSIDGKYFNINFRSYNKDNSFDFKILDEQLRLNNNIQINQTSLIDKENNIYQMKLYIQNISKVNMIYIIFKDSEEYMNNIKITPPKTKNQQINIDTNKYRILCKIYLKNKDN